MRSDANMMLGEIHDGERSKEGLQRMSDAQRKKWEEYSGIRGIEALYQQDMNYHLELTDAAT